MRRIHLGCGGVRLAGWENYDVEVDLSKPLPFPSNSASRIYSSHVIEHLTSVQAWNYLDECNRVLVQGGVVRTAFPNIVKIWRNLTPEYCAAVKKDGFGNGCATDAIKAAIFAHGHQSVWTEDLMSTVLSVIGLMPSVCRPGFSYFSDLVGVERHGQVVGDAIANLETSVVEGMKL